MFLPCDSMYQNSFLLQGCITFYYVCVYTDNILFIYSSVDRHLHCVYLLAIVHNADMNMIASVSDTDKNLYFD